MNKKQIGFNNKQEKQILLYFIQENLTEQSIHSLTVYHCGHYSISLINLLLLLQSTSNAFIISCVIYTSAKDIHMQCLKISQKVIHN